jgi:hypothetical protein
MPLLFLFLGLLMSTASPARPDDRFPESEGWQRLFDGRGLEGWQAMNEEKPSAWTVGAEVHLDPAERKRLDFQPAGASGEGVMINGPDGKAVNLVTSRQHGDIELYVEFLVSEGSNSGVYLQGLYEIQVLDSWGKPPHQLKFGDCGGIYARYIGGQVVGGTAPPINASRAPGEWQEFRIWFRAPRFDAAGNKLENARFIRVIHNGRTLHRNIPVEGPTRAHMKRPESPLGPLMLQGDHGPVAYRNLYWRSLR